MFDKGDRNVGSGYNERRDRCRICTRKAARPPQEARAGGNGNGGEETRPSEENRTSCTDTPRAPEGTGLRARHRNTQRDRHCRRTARRTAAHPSDRPPRAPHACHARRTDSRRAAGRCHHPRGQTSPHGAYRAVDQCCCGGGRACPLHDDSGCRAGLHGHDYTRAAARPRFCGRAGGTEETCPLPHGR